MDNKRLRKLIKKDLNLPGNYQATFGQIISSDVNLTVKFANNLELILNTSIKTKKKVKHTQRSRDFFQIKRFHN